MPAGRPTKYSEEMVENAREYLEGGYKSDGSVIPSECGLALCLGVAKSTVQKWGSEVGKEEFSGILKAIQVKQEGLLLNSGLKGEFNAAITKLVLGKHGYSEKTESETTVNFRGMTDDELWATIRGEM